VAPTITNRDEVRAALIREYEAVLRDQGIGGRVNVWFHITVEGRAEHMQIAESSGLDALDAAALRVADAYEFTPAMNRDQRVAVWVSLPITFAIPVERAPRTR
jgi:TonB family protein